MEEVQRQPLRRVAARELLGVLVKDGLARRKVVRGDARRRQQALVVLRVLRVPLHQGTVRADGLVVPAELGQVLGAGLEEGEAVEVVLGGRLEVLQGARVVALLGDERVLVHDCLGVLIVVARGRGLERVLVRREHLLGLGDVAGEVVGDGEGGPHLAQLRAGLQHGGAALDVALVVAHLHLQDGEVALDLAVLRVELQRELVRLDGLLEVLGRAPQQAVDMPADVRLHIDRERLLAEGKGLVRPELGVHDERLHGHGVAVAGRLLENEVGILQPALVLLVLIVADDLAEEGRLLGGEGLRHGGGLGRVGGGAGSAATERRGG